MISIVRKPQRFTPSNDAIIFQVESDFDEIIYFQVDVLESTTDAIIETLQIDVSPNYQNGSFIDLSIILSSVVKWQINNSQTDVSVALSRPILGYKVKLTEYGLTGSIVSILSPAITLPDTFYVWDAGLGRFKFNKFIYSNYAWVENPASDTYFNFLTNKPDNIVVNDKSSEQLYFIQDKMEPVWLQIETFNSSGTALNYYYKLLDDTATKKMFRLQVSPKVLQDALSVSFTNVDYYTVQLNDSVNAQISERRKYYYRPPSCQAHPQNIFFLNALGGFDVVQMYNVTEANNITRTSIKKNPFQINDGVYSDRDNEILNNTDEVISIAEQGNYTAYSTILSDADCVWLNELFASKQVFIELFDSSLVPVLITNTSYQIDKQYLNKTAYNTTQISYTINGSVLPYEGAGNISGPAPAIYYNVLMSEVFTKNDCTYGTPSQTTYTVAAGTYNSTIDQAAADALAQAEIDAYGQLTANTFGTCSTAGLVGNAERSQMFTRNNCDISGSIGAIGSDYLYVVAANTYYAIDLATANALADAQIAAHGQDEANANGVCYVDGLENFCSIYINDETAFTAFKARALSSFATNTTITINWDLIDATGTNQGAQSPVTISAGNSSSYTFLVPASSTYLSPYTGLITSITPSSNLGTTYTF